MNPAANDHIYHESYSNIDIVICSERNVHLLRKKYPNDCKIFVVISIGTVSSVFVKAVVKPSNKRTKYRRLQRAECWLELRIAPIARLSEVGRWIIQDGSR